MNMVREKEYNSWELFLQYGKGPIFENRLELEE